LNTITLAQSQDTVWYEGKLGVRLAGIDTNKTVTLTAQNGMIDIGTMSLQTGSDIMTYDGSVGNLIAAPILEELVTADGLTVTLSDEFTPAGGVGAEIEWIYKLNGSSISGATKFAQGSSASADEFEYDPATKEITLPTGGVFEAGEVLIVQYKYNASGISISSDTENFSKTAHVVVDLTVRDVCDKSLSHAQIDIPQGRVSGNFSLTAGNDPAVHDVEIEALSSICWGQNKNLFSYRIVEAV
jgi:hypothetical protein